MREYCEEKGTIVSLTSLVGESFADVRMTVLMNIGTARPWQRKGAATALVTWSFTAADRERLPVYLDTTSDGPAKQLFEKLGFEKVDEFEMELGEYGGQGSHSHVAMIRWPRVSE